MVRKSNLCIVAQTATSLTIAPALVATLQRFIFTKTMVLKDKSGVRFVTLNSTLTKIDSQKPLPFVALTAPEYWNLSRVESTLSFTNVETLNALTIFIILKKVDREHLDEKHGKSKYKLHYIYREFTIDFFKMDLSSLPKNASSLNFKRHDSYTMSLCLTYRVNLGLSLRKTAQALRDIHGIKISHQQVANYCTTAAICVKPFTDNYAYKVGKVLTADETYIKIKGIKGYIWFIMDAAKRSILGYQISDNRGVGPCILSMRMALKHYKEKLPEHFKFIADGYSAYPLAAQQFFRQFGGKFKFDITQVIGLTNDDEVSTKYRPYKQMIERLNRTYKESYRPTNGFDNIEGANYDLALWVTYYNFLRPHRHNGYRVLNHVQELDNADNMPGKWQLLIYLGQCRIKQMQQGEAHNCS